MNQLVKQEKYKRNEILFNKLKKIIEDFCKERKLIIYGGLAMDKLLRAAGHQGIYDQYEVPDYDTYSTNFLVDTEDLGRRIHESGVPYVKIHSGFKPSTRKIHITLLSISVIDVNEVSVEHYNALNPKDIDGLLYIRPDALFEDQIKNLVTNLYKDYHRIPKIVKRIPLLLQYFPVIPSSSKYEPSDLKPVGIESWTGIIAGDYVFNYYHTGSFSGIPILYSDHERAENFAYPYYPMEGETIYNIVDGIKIAPQSLLLYFYFKMKIAENTDQYDYQIWYLMKDGFPFPNYKDTFIYHPREEKEQRYEYPKKILLK